MAVALAAAISVAAPAAAETTPPAAQDPGSLGIRLLDVPAAAASDPRAGVYIVDQLKPGATIERRVRISNTSRAPMAVDVYAAAASVADGAFVVADGRTANELSSWTTPSAGNVQVPAGGAVDVTMTVAVPTGAPPGEHYAVIWAQTSGSTGGQILAINRVGVRMYVAVPGSQPLTSSFVVSSMVATRAADGHGTVRVAVRNTGQRALDLSGTLTMSAVGSTVRVGPYQATLGTTVAPGQSDTVVFEITDDIADGPWAAVADLRSGVVTGSYAATITFPEHVGTAVATPAQATTHGLVWWEIALPVVLLAALAALLVALRKRRRTRTVPE